MLPPRPWSAVRQGESKFPVRFILPSQTSGHERSPSKKRVKEAFNLPQFLFSRSFGDPRSWVLSFLFGRICNAVNFPVNDNILSIL